MEESTQRRERLKAMRLEAESHNKDASEHSAVNLSNPLVESTANPEGQVHSFAQSFNYYTDPMAAFSGNKQKSMVSPQDSSSNPSRSQTNETFPSPSFQPHINHSPNPRMHQPQGQYRNANYTYTPNPPQRGNFPNPNWNNNAPRPGGYYGPQGYGFPNPAPNFTRGPPQGGYPRPHFINNPGRGSGRGYPNPNPNPGPRPGAGAGPGPNFRNSPSHGSGRGNWYGNNMGSGRGRGRGGGHNNHVSAEERPDLFYNKSMVEDPWKFLEPVIWKSSKKPWLTQSFGVKKPRVSESPRNQQQSSSSQPSLAEILAKSFHEAASDEPNAE